MSGVIHLITSLERGGAQRNTLETAAALHHPQRPQLVVSGAAGELDAEAGARLGLRFQRVPALQNPIGLHDVTAVLELQRLLRREVERLRAPVVVHTHSSKAGVLGRLAARAVDGAVVVHTVHGFGMQALGARRAWLLEVAEKSVAPLAACTVFVSESDRRTAVDLGLLRAEEEGVLIRSGIDAGRFAGLTARREEARASLGIGDERVVVTVANCKPQKDPLFHADIFRALKERDARARFFFLGGGPLQAEAAARAGAGAVFHDFVDDVSSYLAAADVFLLASAWEGLPRAVLEATAAGLPCVVKDTGWADDVAWAKSVTALPASASAQEFAAALQKKHKAAPKKLPREFTQDGMLEELRALYDSITGPIIDDEERARMRRRRRRHHHRQGR